MSLRQSAHHFQFTLKLTLGLLCRKGVKNVRKLDAVAHEVVGRFFAKPLADPQAVVRVVKELNRLRGSQSAGRQGFNDPQVKKSKNGKLLSGFTTVLGK